MFKRIVILLWMFPMLVMGQRVVIDTLLNPCNSIHLGMPSGADRYIWTPNQGLNNSTSDTVIAHPLNSTIYTAYSFSIDSNGILNGNFEHGNNDFFTHYEYKETNNDNEAQYTVGFNASHYRNGFANMGDHTSGNGLYMIVNASWINNAVVWGQTVNVNPGSYYEITFWLANMHNDSPAQMQVTINGESIGGIYRATSAGQWTECRLVWYNDTAHQIQLALIDRNTSRSGNDFAIDDISMKQYHVTDTAQYKIQIDRDTAIRYGCNYYLWERTNMVYRVNDTVSFHHTTATGCDSLEVVIIDIGHREEDTISAETCTRYYWPASHTIYDTTGKYEYVVQHDSLCDTAMVLNLTILNCPTNIAPDNVDEPSCTALPPGDAFAMREIMRCDNVNSMSTPMVGDIDGDGIPEIICCRRQVGLPYHEGSAGNGIVVFDGRTGVTKFNYDVPTFTTSGQLMSLADVDRDGSAEFFIQGEDGYLYCLNANGGAQIWRSTQRMDARYLVMSADVNNDGIPEVVCGPYVFNALTGNLLLHGSLSTYGKGYGAPHSSSGHGRVYYMQALTDIDHNGDLEFCAGNTIYDVNITNPNGTDGNSMQILRQADNSSVTNCDGQTFLADFDNDGDVDICVIGFCGGGHTRVYVWDGQTSNLVGYYEVYMGGQYDGTMTPSIPFSGDLDGNGTPEIIFNHPDGMRAFTYDPSTLNHIRQMHYTSRFGETAGFTVFDFNQDGKEEIVYRNTGQMYIVDGTTLADLCAPLTTYSGTVCEYTIVADVNADGHAEIIVNHAYNPWNGYNAGGVVSVFGSQQLDAWGSARKVWNQWAYNSVNINDDLTVPQYQFDIASTFPNGKQPFNGFLRQMPHLDQNGDIYINVSNLEADNANIRYAGDGATVSVDYSNHGDSRLNGPYSVTIYADKYRGEVIGTYQMDSTLEKNRDTSMSMFIPMSLLCHLTCDTIAIALNDAGTGIGQNGNQQPECDTTNNVVLLPLKPFIPLGDTLRTHACNTFVWSRQHQGVRMSNEYTKTVFVADSLLDQYGCDSIRALDLFVTYSFIDSITDTACDSYTWRIDGNTYTYSQHVIDSMHDQYGCDSVWHLALTINYSYHFYPRDTVSDTLLPYYFIDREYNHPVRRDHFYYQTIHQCDSEYFFTLVVDYHRVSCDGMLKFPSLITPNGDGTNERFVIQNLLWQDCYPENELAIYNRWGRRVYYIHNIRKPEDFWNPNDMPSGTYYYTFRGRGIEKTVERSGVVEIINPNK